MSYILTPVGRRSIISESVLEETAKPYALHAEHGETGRKKHLGDFESPAHAKAHIDKLEKSKKFPVGHDAVLTHKATGKQKMYTDKWEDA